MALDKMQIHEFCNDIFTGYEILNLELEGNDVILKVKSKKSDNSQDVLEVLNSMFEPFFKLNPGTPS